MHVLGHYGKENAAAIFELFLECMPEYPLDKPDNEGNTGTVAVLIIIVVNANGTLAIEWTVTCILLFILFNYSSAPGLHERKCKSVPCHCEGWGSTGRQ